MLDIKSCFFVAKTPVCSTEHKGSYRIFTNIIFTYAVQYCKNRESLVP